MLCYVMFPCNSSAGITNTLGRVVMGFLADLKQVSPLLLHNMALLSAGAACLSVRFCVEYWSLVIYALVFGLCIGQRSLPSHQSINYTYTRLTALCPGPPGRAGTRKVKPIWILLEQEIVSGSGISWTICKSAARSRQITTPAPHHSVFTGRMPFLPPNQQRQSTEGNQSINRERKCVDAISTVLVP